MQVKKTQKQLTRWIFSYPESTLFESSVFSFLFTHALTQTDKKLYKYAIEYVLEHKTWQ